MKAEMQIPSELPLAEAPDIRHIITEDDTPVDNIFSEKQQRLLTDSLNSSWNPGRDFFAAANVGIFNAIHQPPIVPDMFLSLDVRPAADLWKKKNRSYFLWEFGKPPELVVEIVSNTKGGENSRKFEKYAQIGVWYYIIFDPQCQIQSRALRFYELTIGEYIPKVDRNLSRIGLGFTLQEGLYEGCFGNWLRWTDSKGNLIPTGFERSLAEQKRADEEKNRADTEYLRAEKLAEKLRAMGINPEDI